MNWINCTLCEKQYCSKNAYYKHVRLKHPESVAEICIRKTRLDYSRTPREHYICSSCDQCFSRKDSLKTHIFSAHHVGKPQQKVLCAIETCKLCENKYSSKSAYYKHVRLKHPESVAEICIRKPRQYYTRTRREHHICTTCNQRFSRKDFLRTHIFSAHRGGKRQKKILCAFENCNLHLSNYNRYYDHLLLIHHIEINEEKIVFGNHSDFVQWKEEYELQHNMSFTLVTGRKLKKCPSASYLHMEYYSCHRSYFPHITSGRRIKFVGSRKIGVCCPCRMKVTVRKNETVACFTDTHLGHTCDPRKISLNPIEKRNIVQKLSDGVSFERILEDIEHSAINSSIKSQMIKRLHLTDRQDLYNICKEFKLLATATKDQNGATATKHQNEATATKHQNEATAKKHRNYLFSIKTWIEEMCTLGNDNPVLYVKFQHEDDPVFKKEDFILVLMTQFQQEMYLQFGNDIICMDGTHGLSSYNFYLYSLIIIDEFGNGIPIAFCLSNLKSNLVYKTFFNSIKTQVGTVTPCVFMSDLEDTVYSAWESVMGAIKYKLLCLWHIFKDWTENLNKITNMHKRELIKKLLRNLCYELDSEKFETSLDIFIEELGNDEETRIFYIYFKKEWYSKPNQWAMCYRKSTGISTNMVLESLHKQITYFYLSGLTSKRLDKSIHALMRLTNPDVFKCSIRLHRGKRSHKMKCISKAHENSINIEDENILLITDNFWSVLSSSKKDMLYEVLKINDTCPENSCGLKCATCNICIHMYLCTCLDSTVHLNICKHIHAVSRITSSPVNQHVEENLDLTPAENEINYVPEVIEDDVVHLPQIIPTNNVEDVMPQILSKLHKAIEICNQIQVLPSQNEGARQVTQKVDNLLTDLVNLRENSSNLQSVTWFYS